MNKVLSTLTLAACLSESAVAQVAVYLDESQPIEVRVKDALSRMTIEEKVAMCHGQSKFSSPGCRRLGIPELWMSDGPHGVRAEISWNSWAYAGWNNDSVTAFPALTCLAATWNPAMAARYGMAVGEEARYREKDVLLGPGLNIYRTPLNGRNFEYMGEDPCLAAVMAVPYIQNLQKNGVAACVKHFVLNDQEQWRGHIDVDLSNRALHEIYLPPFKAAAIKGGAWTFMGSYNKIRGTHGCHNDLTICKILKGDWDYDGVLITDWGGAHDTYEAAVNGLDLEMGTYTNGLTSESKLTYDEYYLAKPYLKMLQEGRVPLSTLDDKASRLLRLIFRTAMNTQKPFGSVCSADHYAAAREIGDEGIVLLKNDAPKKQSRLLPIDATKYRKIMVVGDNATRRLSEGGGSSELKVKDYVSPLDGLRALYGDKIVYSQGYAAGSPSYGRVNPVPRSKADSLHDAAVALARDEVDLIIFVGGLNKNHQQDCEAGDRQHFGLPFGQPELIGDLMKVCPNMVLVLLSGNAVELPFADRVSAIVQAWYMGSMTGQSLADVLSGAVNPSGKLPFTFGKRLQDYGAHSFDALCYPGDSIHEVYKEDILVGYRWFDSHKIAPLFAFGHGLSYTTFAYGKPQLSAKTIAPGESLTVSVVVRNTGNVAGKEVVQCYVGDEKCSVLRPVKELKHFTKIMLQPGEEQTVRFTIEPDDLKFYDEASGAYAGHWIAEPGRFKVYVGGSSADVEHVAQFELR